MTGELPEVLTRAEQQRRTREALVDAALRVFARDGFHGASLEGIAAEAGYSKGAVYSNFSSKAELFIAVIDRRFDMAAQQPPWAPLDTDADGWQRHLNEQLGDEGPLDGAQLASVEFIAAAARDPALLEQLQERLDRAVALYRDVASRSRRENDELTVDELAALAFALDQGVAMLALFGLEETIDARIVAAGFRRLLDPSSATGRTTDNDR